MCVRFEHLGQSGGRGVDSKASVADPMNSRKTIIQCKHQDSLSFGAFIQSLGIVEAECADRILVVTTESFTRS